MIRVLFFPLHAPAMVLEIKPDFLAVQKLLDGAYFERVRVGPRTHLYVDEEGALKGLAPNVVAPSYPRPMLGPAVLIAEAPDAQGELDFAGLTDEELAEGMKFSRGGRA